MGFFSKDNDETEPLEINRFAVVLEPKDAFIAWARSCPDCNDDAALSVLKDENIVYLIPANEEGLEKWLKKNYMRMFKTELSSWYRVDKFWPRDTSYKKFQEFFNIRVNTVVHDVADLPLEYR